MTSTYWHLLGLGLGGLYGLGFGVLIGVACCLRAARAAAAAEARSEVRAAFGPLARRLAELEALIKEQDEILAALPGLAHPISDEELRRIEARIEQGFSLLDDDDERN